MERPAKRQRRGELGGDDGEPPRGSAGSGRSAPQTLAHPISPPRRRAQPPPPPQEDLGAPHVQAEERPGRPQRFKSPFQLTAIRDLPAETNIDAVMLRDVLGDPLIAECWEFNYLHDIDFLMGHFDEDVRDLVKVHVVHGFWKREDESRLALQEQASRYKNVTLHTAPMPEMFGTHHSKMLILLRHDDMAQVIIHTANMIPRDWANMAQGVWRSPLLPLMQEGEDDEQGESKVRMGNGVKFKKDLLNYLREYDARTVFCRHLVERLKKYDFSAIRAVLIASVPGRHMRHDDSATRWGWAALAVALGFLTVKGEKAEVVIQISSIATLGPKDTWLRQTLFKALGSATDPRMQTCDFKVVFPTPDEVCRSLDGYSAGASIHTKIQSPQQQKQLGYLTPILHHWANDAPKGAEPPEDIPAQDAGRKRAAPHIKTYIRYAADGSIDWALLTSANLSKQAWGDAESSGQYRIASWEIGVMVWPSLFDREAVMRPTFGSDEPSPDEADGGRPVVALRLPYSLPLQAYGRGEKPWVATASYDEPDWKGVVWRD